MANGSQTTGTTEPRGTGGGPGNVIGAGAADPSAALSLAQLAHELSSRLDGSMRALRLALRDLPPGADAQMLRSRLTAAESAMGDMSAMLERSMRPGANAESMLHSSRMLGEEVRAILALVCDDTRAADVTITLDLSPDLETLPAGPIGTILINGLRNALAALHRGGARTQPARIAVVFTREAGWLQLFVEDNGPGFGFAEHGTGDEADHGSAAHAWEAGEEEDTGDLLHDRDRDQEYTARPAAMGGHGLGLTICRRAAEALGGRVDLLHPPHGSGAVLSAAIPLSRMTRA